MKAGIFCSLRGYVNIRVWGHGTERFFRLCTAREIMLWNLRRCGDGAYCCNISLQDFPKLRQICRKTKTRVRIVKRSGAPWYCRRYKNRLIFFLAFLGMLSMVYRCSKYIWNIEIIGNSYLSDGNLLRFLKEQGIAPGIECADIDTDALELLLRQSYAQVIWSSAYVDGTSLVICIREQLKTDDAVAADTAAETASDLVATKNATVFSIITRKGTPCVVAGDEVLAGDVLVSAANDIIDDNGEVMYSLYQQADADVYGYVDYYFSESLPIRDLVTVEGDEQKRSFFLQLPGWYFVFPYKESPYEEYYSLENTSQLCLTESFYLPVYWGTLDYVKREKGLYILALEAAKQTAKEDFLYFVGELEENGVSIIDKNVMIKEAGDFYEVSGHVLALEPIAAESPVKIPLQFTP
jgi:similar to stage IV sporulation protein